MVSWTSETRKKVALWATKMDRDPKGLFDKLTELYEVLKVSRPDMSEESLQRLARIQLARTLKAMPRVSPAIPYEGIFFGYSEKRDVTMEDGAVVAFRTCVGIGRPSEPGSDIKMIHLSLSNEQAELIPPLGITVTFYANPKEESSIRYGLNGSVKTEFVQTVMPEFPEIDNALIIGTLLGGPTKGQEDDYVVASLGDLREYIQDHAKDKRVTVITQGDALRVRREPTGYGSYLVVLQDVDTQDIEEDDVTVWVHPELVHQLDFGAGSKVVVVGRPRIDSNGNPTINAYGIWVIPEYRVSPEEEMLFEPMQEIEVNGGGSGS